MRHGNGGYAQGCRCWECTEGRKEYMRRYRLGIRNLRAPGKREGPKAPVDHENFWDKVHERSRLADLDKIECL